MNTSFLIKCGHDGFRKQIVNINLKQSKLWKTGSIILNTNTYYYRLNPTINTKLEMIKLNNSYLLTVNGGIIYENKNPFFYNTELIFHNDKETNFSEKNISTCFHYEFIKMNELKEINNFRTLN